MDKLQMIARLDQEYSVIAGKATRKAKVLKTARAALAVKDSLFDGIAFLRKDLQRQDAVWQAKRSDLKARGGNPEFVREPEGMQILHLAIARLEKFVKDAA